MAYKRGWDDVMVKDGCLSAHAEDLRCSSICAWLNHSVRALQNLFGGCMTKAMHRLPVMRAPVKLWLSMDGLYGAFC